MAVSIGLASPSLAVLVEGSKTPANSSLPGAGMGVKSRGGCRGKGAGYRDKVGDKGCSTFLRPSPKRNSEGEFLLEKPDPAGSSVMFTKTAMSLSLPTPRVQELLPLFFSRAFIRSDMKSACLPPPAIRGAPADCGSPSCPVCSILFGGSGTGFFAGGGGGLLEIGGGGGGNGTSPLLLLEIGGGGGTKSGGGSQKSDGGGGGKSIFNVGGGAGKLSGSVRKMPLSRFTLGGRTGEAEIADERLSGGGGGCSEVLLLWTFCGLRNGCARPGALALFVSAFNKEKNKTTDRVSKKALMPLPKNINRCERT